MRSQQLVTIGEALVVLGIVFSENQLVGYLFIGAGVLLSIITAFRLRRKSRMQINRTGGV
jgi:hypothetical protein